MSEIVRLPHSQWELYYFGAFREYWAKRIDRKITEEEKRRGFLQVLLAYSAERRQQKIEEQDQREVTP